MTRRIVLGAAVVAALLFAAAFVAAEFAVPRGDPRIIDISFVNTNILRMPEHGLAVVATVIGCFLVPGVAWLLAWMDARGPWKSVRIVRRVPLAPLDEIEATIAGGLRRAGFRLEDPGADPDCRVRASRKDRWWDLPSPARTGCRVDVGLALQGTEIEVRLTFHLPVAQANSRSGRRFMDEVAQAALGGVVPQRPPTIPVASLTAFIAGVAAAGSALVFRLAWLPLGQWIVIPVMLALTAPIAATWGGLLRWRSTDRDGGTLAVAAFALAAMGGASILSL